MFKKIKRYTTISSTPANFAKTILFSLILLKLLGFILNKIFFIFLDQNEFGIYTLFVSGISTLGAITALGLPSYILRHCTEIGKDPDRQKNGEIFITGLSLNIIAVFFVVFILLISNFMFEFEIWGEYDLFLFLLIGLLNIFQQIGTAIRTYSTTNHKIKNYIILKIGPTFFLLCLGIILSIVFNLRILGLILALFISEVIIGAISLKKILQIAKIQKPRLKIAKKILNYSGPIYLMGLTFSIYNFSLYYLTGMMWGISELTLFAAAFSVANLVGIFNPLFQMGFKSVSYHLYEMSSYKKLNNLTNQTLKLSMIFLLPLYSLIYFFSQELIAIFSIESYSIAFQLVPFLLANNLIITLYPLLCPGSVLRKKTKLLALINILGIAIAFLFSNLFINSFGYIGMGIAFLFQSLLNLILQIPLSQYYYHLSFKLKPLITIAIVFISACIVYSYLIFGLSLNHYISSGIFLIIYAILILVTRQFSESDWLFIKKMLVFRNN